MTSETSDFVRSATLEVWGWVHFPGRRKGRVHFLVRKHPYRVHKRPICVHGGEVCGPKSVPGGRHGTDAAPFERAEPLLFLLLRHASQQALVRTWNELRHIAQSQLLRLNQALHGWHEA